MSISSYSTVSSVPQTAHPYKPAARQNKSGLGETVVGLVILVVLGLIVWSILPDSFTDKIKYSTAFQIDAAQVHWNNPPTDCDFMHAPLGEKSCHYKKTVTAYNAAGYPVAGNDAPKYAKNANGNTIVSYDEGKTWSVLESSVDLRIKTVEIGWTKVTD